MKIAAIVLAAMAVPAQASDVKRDETVVFFPTAARWIDGEASWDVPIHGWIYEPERYSGGLAEWLATLATGEGVSSLGATDICAERAALFLADNERGKHIRVRICGRDVDLPPSEANGHFAGTVRINESAVLDHRIAEAGSGHRLEYRAVLPESDPRVFTGRVHLVPPVGFSVISDIDDTIKISHVTDRTELLANTFFRPFREVAGMGLTFRGWTERGGVTFHYVSGSPWQLYGPLAEFLEREGFPEGAFDLRYFRWKDHTLFDFFDSPEGYKAQTIEGIVARYPSRRFVLVGDSGEKDPEVYGEIARRHRNQIEAILIRDVTGEDRTSGRYSGAFADIPESLWRIFEDPAEITGVLPPADRAR